VAGPLCQDVLVIYILLLVKVHILETLCGRLHARDQQRTSDDPPGNSRQIWLPAPDGGHICRGGRASLSRETAGHDHYRTGPAVRGPLAWACHYAHEHPGDSRPPARGGMGAVQGVLVDSSVLLDIVTDDPYWFAWSSEALATRAEQA